MTIHQGHPYRLGDVKVIALDVSRQSESTVRVGIVDALGWFSHRTDVNPDWLEPMPLRYLGGEHAE